MHVHPHAEGKEVGNFTIESDGKKYLIELRPAHEESTQHPFFVSKELRREAAKIRPGLALEEAMTLDDEQLIRGGYSPRPHLGNDGKVPELWLKSTLTPLTIVEPKLHARPDLVRSPRRKISDATTTMGTSPNWSGVEVRSNGPTYNLVSGN
jgi:hypothetical protein